jgi:hypothetical protein
VTDQVSYHALALRVLDGHGFSFATGWWPATRANQPTAHWSFLYVLFLAAVYSVAGPAPLAARLVQALIVGILHPILVWRIGNRVFGQNVGLVSAAASAIYGYFVFYGGALVTESLYFVSVLWVLDVVTALGFSSLSGRAASLPGLRLWTALGAALAAAALMRQTFLLVIPIILAWLAWELLRQRGHGGRRMIAPLALTGRVALALAVLGVCILPWTARNYRAFGQFVLLNTNAGYVFFYGAHPAHGTEFVPLQANGSAAYQALMPGAIRTLNEAQLERVLLGKGIEFVKAEPGRYALLCVSRIKEYFKFWPTADSGRASNLVRVLSFGVFLPFLLGGAGLALARHGEHRARSGTLLLLSVAAVYSLVHILTWTLVRYRLPVDAIAMPFVGVSAVALFSRLRTPARPAPAHVSSSAN